jgi:hypothetical protein
VVLVEVAGLKLLPAFKYANFLAGASHTRGRDTTAIAGPDNDDLVMAPF